MKELVEKFMEVLSYEKEEAKIHAQQSVLRVQKNSFCTKQEAISCVLKTLEP